MGLLKTLHAALGEIAGDEELLVQCRAAAEAVHRDAAETLHAFIELGRAGCAIEDNNARSRRTAGQHATNDALNLLATAAGVQREALNRAIRTVRWFDDAQLQSFLTRTNAAGRLITPAHLQAIAKAEADEQRRRLVELFYEKAATTQQLGRLARPARENLRRGRVVSMDGGVGNLCSMIRVLHNAIQHEGYGLREVLFDRLRAFAQGDGQPAPGDLEHVSRLRTALESLQGLLAPAIELAADAEVALEERLQTDEEA